MLIGIDASRAEAKLKTGVERYSYEIIRAMRATLPLNAEVVLYSYAPLPKELGPWNDKWKNKVLSWPLRYAWTALRLTWEMWRHPVNVLFVPGYRLPMILPKRSVTVIHDATFLEFSELYSSVDLAAQKAILDDSCRRASAIIVPSQFTKDQLAALKPAHLEVVPLGVSLPKIKPSTIISNPYFVFVGRVDKKKNLSVAIDGFVKFSEKHPDYSLMIVGRPSFGYDDILAYAKNSPAAARIFFTGPLPDKEMLGLVKNATALVHPCPVEGFGLPVIEAMSLGTPVVVANHGAAAEAAGDAALLVSPTDGVKWAEAMEQITFDIFRNPLIEKGRARAKEFTWLRAAEATWKVLLNVKL